MSLIPIIEEAAPDQSPCVAQGSARSIQAHGGTDGRRYDRTLGRTVATKVALARNWFDATSAASGDVTARRTPAGPQCRNARRASSFEYGCRGGTRERRDDEGTDVSPRVRPSVAESFRTQRRGDAVSPFAEGTSRRAPASRHDLDAPDDLAAHFARLPPLGTKVAPVARRLPPRSTSRVQSVAAQPAPSCCTAARAEEPSTPSRSHRRSDLLGPRFLRTGLRLPFPGRAPFVVVWAAR